MGKQTVGSAREGGESVERRKSSDEELRRNLHDLR